MAKVDLMTGDALFALANVPSNSVNGGVIDPPYGKKVRGIRWDLVLPNFLIWVELLRVLKPGAHIAVFCFPDMAHRLAFDLEKAGFEIRNVWVWHYPNGMPATQPLNGEVDSRLVPGHESIVIARKKTDCNTYTENVAKWGTGGLRTKNTLGDGKSSTTVFAYNKPTDWERDLGADALPLRPVNPKPRTGKSAHHKSKKTRRNFHFCVKPVALLTHLLKLIAKPGDTVIDPFMGSGSAGMAAVWAGMNYIGIDMNLDFVRIADARITYAQANPIPDRLVPGFVAPAKAARKARSAGQEVVAPVGANHPGLDHVAQDRLDARCAVAATAKAAGDVLGRKGRGGRRKDAAHSADLVQPVARPSRGLRRAVGRPSKVRRDLLGSVGLGGLVAKTGHLVLGAKPFNIASGLAGLSRLIERDQPHKHLFLGSDLRRGLVRRGRGRARHPHQRRGQVRPAIGFQYRPVDFVVKVAQDLNLTRVLDVALGLGQWGHIGPAGQFAQAFQRVVEARHRQVRVCGDTVLAEGIQPLAKTRQGVSQRRRDLVDGRKGEWVEGARLVVSRTIFKRSASPKHPNRADAG